MTNGKIRRVLSEERQHEDYRFHLAKKMIGAFGYRSWMSEPNVRSEGGERITRPIYRIVIANRVSGLTI